MAQDNISSPHLDQIIECVKQINEKQSKSGQKMQNLEGEVDNLIKNFQSSINRCKRYNEAKINRKYEMIIQQLQSQVRKLNQKLKIQQDARSPTKKHVTDILDQLVIYKQENQKLRKQLQQSRDLIQELQTKCENQGAAIKKMQNVQPNAHIERLPALNPTASVSDSIKQYLKDKQNVRRVVSNSQRSNLEKFLHQNQAKSWNWTLGNLLQELDKWSEGVKPNKHVDMWKIRSSVARSFSEYLDDSQTLTRPASFTKNVLNPISSYQKQFAKNKKNSRFSVFDDRRNQSVLDSSIHQR